MKNKIIYWTSTIVIFLFEGLMPALTSQSEMAKEGLRHLGYPLYFGITLVVFKVLGSLLLILPMIPKRVKEWVYAGFGLDFMFATISHAAVDGFNAQTFLPIVIFGILIVSYIYHHKLVSKTS